MAVKEGKDEDLLIMGRQMTRLDDKDGNLIDHSTRRTQIQCYCYPANDGTRAASMTLRPDLRCIRE